MSFKLHRISTIISTITKTNVKRLKNLKLEEVADGKGLFEGTLGVPADPVLVAEFHDFLKIAEHMGITRERNPNNKVFCLYEFIYILYEKEMFEEAIDLVNYYKEITNNQTTHILQGSRSVRNLHQQVKQMPQLSQVQKESQNQPPTPVEPPPSQVPEEEKEKETETEAGKEGMNSQEQEQEQQQQQPSLPPPPQNIQQEVQENREIQSPSSLPEQRSQEHKSRSPSPSSSSSLYSYDKHNSPSPSSSHQNSNSPGLSHRHSHSHSPSSYHGSRHGSHSPTSQLHDGNNQEHKSRSPSQQQHQQEQGQLEPLPPPPLSSQQQQQHPTYTVYQKDKEHSPLTQLNSPLSKEEDNNVPFSFQDDSQDNNFMLPQVQEDYQYQSHQLPGAYRHQAAPPKKDDDFGSMRTDEMNPNDTMNEMNEMDTMDTMYGMDMGETEDFISIPRSYENNNEAQFSFTEEVQKRNNEMETENEDFETGNSYDGYENESEGEDDEDEDDSDGDDEDDDESSGNEKRRPLRKRRKLNRQRMLRMNKQFYESSDEEDDANNSDYDNVYDSEMRDENRDNMDLATMERSLTPSPVQSDDEDAIFYDPKKKNEGGRLIKYTLKQRSNLTEGIYINPNSIPTEILFYTILETLRREGIKEYKDKKHIIIKMLKNRSVEEALDDANYKFNFFRKKVFQKEITSYKVMNTILRMSAEVRDKLSFEFLYRDIFNVKKNKVKRTEDYIEEYDEEEDSDYDDMLFENAEREIVFKEDKIYDKKDNVLEHFRLFQNAVESKEQMYFGPEVLEKWIDIAAANEIDDSQVAEQEMVNKRYIISNNYQGKKIELAKDFSKLLMKHQKEGIRFLWNSLVEHNTGAILADEMGMGKTLTVLGFIDTFIYYQHRANILILLPKAVIETWKDDILKYHKRPYSFRYYKSYPKRRTVGLKNGCAFLITYEAFNKFKDIHDWPDILILDEGHLLKNEETKRNASVSKFKTKKKLILTGSPIQNNLDEFTTMIKFVNKKRGEDFERDYQSIVSGNTEALKRYSDVICRRLIKDTIKDEIPQSYSVTLFLKLQEAQKKIFDVITQIFEKSKIGNVFLIQEFISWVLVHPAVILDLNESTEKRRKKEIQLIHPFAKLTERKEEEMDIKERIFKRVIKEVGEIEDLNSEANSAKIIAVNKIVQYAASRKEKVVIFTKFIGSLDIIEKFLPKGIKSIKLSGKTTERESSIKRFHSDADITVLLLSIKAYGHGLNLTCANHLILAEHDWNPTYEVQAAMRIYRKGQTKNTYIYRLVTSNTYDEKMYSVGVKKEGLSKAVLDQMNGKPVKLNEVGVWRIYDNEDNPNIKYTQPTNDVFREIVRQLGDYLKGIAEHEEILGLNSI